MSYSIKRSAVFALLLTVTLTSCKDDEPSQPSTPTILYSIKGAVNLYDESGLSISDSGMMITALGSNPTFSAITDDMGEFALEDLPKGTYTLEFEKTGFGSYKVFNVDHTSNEPTFLTQTPSLSELSTTSVTMVSAQINNDSLFLDASLDQPANSNNPKIVRVFMGTNNDLSPEKYDFVSDATEGRIDPIRIEFSKSELLAFGFQSGETVYVNVAGDSFFSNNYLDPDSGMNVFPNILWTSSGDSFIVP